MKEEYLHIIWRFQLYNATSLTTSKHEPIVVYHPGILNHHAGPDFLNARIKIGEIEWAGDVEIHIQETDWYTHGHYSDPAYNSVVLHVVVNAGRQAVRHDSTTIPTLFLPLDEKVHNAYQSLMSNQESIPCGSELKQFDIAQKSFWIKKAAIDRLEKKSILIKQLLNEQNGDWEQVFFIAVARGFGLNVNQQPFEQWAKSIAFVLIDKYRNNLLTLEALFFGQAGMLEDSPETEDEYFNLLKQEYQFLKHKHSLKALPHHLWKYFRMRPAGFPTRRIAQMAAIFCRRGRFFSSVAKSLNLSSILLLFDVEASDYWKIHCKFGTKNILRQAKPGKSTVESIIINAVVPVVFTYAQLYNDYHLVEQCLNVLEEVQPETNKTTKIWTGYGIKPENALASQGMLELFNHFCSPRKCLDCKIGNQLLIESFK